MSHKGLQANQNNNRYRETPDTSYSDDDNEGRYKLTSNLIKLTNVSIFGLGTMIFIIGVLYLSIYRYEYSFTTFSIDLMAGIFVALGIVLSLFAFLSILVMSPFGRPSSSLLFAGFVFLSFILLFILGVIGLSMNGNGEFLTYNRNNIFYTAREFNEQIHYKHATKKINWLQRKFLCCGVDSYADWKSIVTFRGNSAAGFYNYPKPNDLMVYPNRNQYDNKYPYIDDVPDSCCINWSAGCGKQAYSFGRDRGSIINLRGCLFEYNRYFSKDIAFLCALSVIVSIILLGMSLIQMFMFSLIKRNYQNLIKTYQEQERRRFVNN